MGLKKAASLCVALILGSAFAMAVSSWNQGGNPQQAANHQHPIQPGAAPSSASREPEFLANSNPSASLIPATPLPTEPSGAIPASFDEPDASPAAAGEPALMPADDASADELPLETPADETPADETPSEETPAAETPADNTPAAEAAELPATPDRAAEVDLPGTPPLSWHDDYRQAMHAAVEQQRDMFILFCQPGSTATQRAFEQQTLADPRSREKLTREFVLAKLPSNAVITSQGKQVELLKHPAFAEMLGRPGMAIIDLSHPQADYFGHVVSTFPFTPGKYYKRPVLSVALNLPPGTLTQRTMIYAVRVHPEAPASTQGQFHRVLADEANRQSHYQAAILVQGHQNWESRVHRISTRSPSVNSPQEVVAESWPSENLVDACIDCVDSWRQSPGHWEAVRSRHPVFGFDIQRGRNGIWYATGIFGHR
jgi:hypothetical protein